jgi:hypothetical protein
MEVTLDCRASCLEGEVVEGAEGRTCRCPTCREEQVEVGVMACLEGGPNCPQWVVDNCFQTSTWLELVAKWVASQPWETL